MTTPLHILLTNDDGYAARGLTKLYESLKTVHQCVVVAPMEQQSGCGHAFTYKKPLFCRTLTEQDPVPGYAISGTPSDCVKFSFGHLLDKKPDLVVSGINEGSNAGIAGFYSGTIAAAREAAFWRVPAIAFSLCERGSAYLEAYKDVAVDLIASLYERFGTQKNSEKVFYNVNFPPCSPEESKGVLVCKQSLSFYNDTYEKRVSADSKEEFWIQGDLEDLEPSNEYDAPALEQNYITITPLHFDATAYDQLSALSDIQAPFTRRENL